MNPEMKEGMEARIRRHSLDKVSYAIGIATGLNMATPITEVMDMEPWDVVQDVIDNPSAFTEVEI